MKLGSVRLSKEGRQIARHPSPDDVGRPRSHKEVRDETHSPTLQLLFPQTLSLDLHVTPWVCKNNQPICRPRSKRFNLKHHPVGPRRVERLTFKTPIYQTRNHHLPECRSTINLLSENHSPWVKAITGNLRQASEDDETTRMSRSNFPDEVVSRVVEYWFADNYNNGNHRQRSVRSSSAL
jgi:hypothetical protein